MSTKTSIPIHVKKKCCEMKQEGSSVREIYKSYYSKEIKNPCTYETFKRAIRKWEDRPYPDDLTLECGTYEGFTAHNATVQVSKSGEIIQAWIKQKVDNFDLDDFVASLKENIEHYKYTPKYVADANHMLEIPLFDMHWGISFFEDYEPVLNELLDLIHSRHWDRIVIPFGQDFFHNDSVVNPVTTKGTVIEKVDMIRAVKEGRKFITAVIDSAIKNSNETKVIYTPGNHDRSVSWMFMQVLLERYGENVVDDSMEYRKVITYGFNSIMITHGNSKQATAKNLAHIFPISFPEEFAKAKIREVHSAHLHHETEADVFGVMVRRLSTGVVTDDWSNREDFVGSHRRFMIFEWNGDGLRSIHYL